ncbi:glycosyltransferase family 2 protein [Thiocapsa rosea]|uniref:Cellulose synthase (UDP-forming) n=1 Tax=Thiocapsa rosea TaxID=69360 RepID=A0A495VB21_9GAMM|nr:cellulose synthase catalytic subunit [Thiocapsa rosea]RKT46591.1 cellulose synthase (UDP-forming) [Thiocapsa rosea]
MDKGSAHKRPIFSIALITAVVALVLYLIVRTSLFVLADYVWYEKSIALLLLFAEFFIMLHAFGYFLNLYHVLHRDSAPRQISMDEVPELTDYPPVAIIVSSFKEPLDIIEGTLTCFYNLTYPNKHVYFLDDTRYDRPGDDPEQMRRYREQIDALCERIGVNLFRRSWRGAKAGMINDFLDFIEGHPKPGFTFHSFEESFALKREKEKYIIVFDADMNPLPDFVDPLVAFMEANPTLAFIQTPQYYTNFETNRVARASGLQQAVFYEYICEGKSEQDAMFCCGTNVIFRREALMDVEGFDESSVTEDFATSLKFHARGWSSAYLNKICAFGMGPEDLGAYFKQQFRWALGTVGLFRTIVGAFVRNPRMLSASKWWEYFLSGTHYFVGWALLIMMTTPVVYLFFETPSYFVRPEIYALFFLPYFILTMTLFIYSMAQRRYGFKELGSGIVLQAITLPVYLRASLLGIIGVKGTFGITPKGGSTSLPLIKLWPQILLAAICVASIGWGISRLYFERDAIWAVTVNMVWCVYHAGLLSAVIYFNHPEEDGA